LRQVQSGLLRVGDWWGLSRVVKMVRGQREGAGMCARRRTFFSCLAKKRRQKKATLLSASLPASRRSGQPAVLAPGGVARNSLRCASLKQSRALYPPGAALLGAYRRAGIPHGHSLRSALWKLGSDSNYLQIKTLFALSNLWMVRHTLMGAKA